MANAYIEGEAISRMADDDQNNTGDDQNTGNDDDQSNNDSDDLDTWKANARKWERDAKNNKTAAQERDELRKQLEERENATKSDHEKELDKVRQEAADKARTEANSNANKRILKSEVRVAAAGKLADPEDAVRFLDLDDFKVSDDGEIDGKEVANAIARLLKEKPYLAADAGKKKFGDANQGVRGGGGNGPSMNDLIRQKAGRG